MEVKIYERFLNNSVRSLYSKGVFTKAKQVTKKGLKTFFRSLQFFRQPRGLKKTLFMEVGLTEAPILHISQRDGITVSVRVRVRVSTLRSSRIRTFKKQKHLFSVSARLKVSAMMMFKGQNLSVFSPKVHFAIESRGWLRKKMVKCISRFLTKQVKKAVDGVMIPLPPVVDFSRFNIYYYDGFVMVSGSLDVPAAGVQMLENQLEQLMKMYV